MIAAAKNGGGTVFYFTGAMGVGVLLILRGLSRFWRIYPTLRDARRLRNGAA
jgi:hypothetical protein